MIHNTFAFHLYLCSASLHQQPIRRTLLFILSNIKSHILKVALNLEMFHANWCDINNIKLLRKCLEQQNLFYNVR